MSDGLEAIRRHVHRFLTQEVRPIYLVVDDQLHLRAWCGDTAPFGLPALEPGLSLADRLPLLATADPRNDEPRVWRFVELSPGFVSHVHRLRLRDGWGIALLDAREEHKAQQSRQQVAHELLLLRDERERLLAELEEANRLKTEFIARMSHEFRTPLASVIGYTDTLRELRPEDPEVQTHLGAVGRGARYLLNLIENLLDEARIEIDALTVDCAACDLRDLSDEVEQLLRPLAEQKSLSLAWGFDGEVPPRIRTDAIRLKQVLINLVGNAIKFTQRGGISVEFAWADDRLRVRVADTGPGIAEQEAQSIFEPFRQGDRGQHGKGAGLGLTISRSLVQALGGDLRLSKNAAEGACFQFEISARTVPSGKGADTNVLRDKVVVIADDDPDLRELFSLYLKAAGCRTHAVNDAQSARRAVAERQPAVVLLDLHLGREDGAALALELRRTGFAGRLVSLSAANDGTGSNRDAFDAAWTKPISRNGLLQALTDLLA